MASETLLGTCLNTVNQYNHIGFAFVLYGYKIYTLLGG